MKDNELYTNEELKLFSTIENQETQSLSKNKLQEEKALLKEAALNTIEKKTKKKALNIRLFEDDIEKIKAIALKEGLPYQTYLSSMIHKLALGQLKVS
jgi:predicted DNA binding CopG/RHH family protein